MFLGLTSDVDGLLRVVFLMDYNTRLVVLSTTLLGVSSGLIGSFLLLRKRSLMGDALSHATLPGIALAFLVAVYFGGTGKSLSVLLGGAVITGVLGVLAVTLIRSQTRIKDDTAMGVVLSVFFGAGIVLLGIIQTMPQARAAGLESFIYGKTASMVYQDFMLLSAAAIVCLVLSLLLFKEFRLLCFDEGFAQSQGWSVLLLDLLMLFLVTGVTVAGLQTVGLILIIAFLIIPAASARMWTFRFGHMLALAAVIGGASGWLGASLSAMISGLPAGAVIVLTAASIFIFSLLLGADRGVLVQMFRSRSLRQRIRRQHLLRALYEILEMQVDGTEVGTSEFKEAVSCEDLRRKRTWSGRELRRIIEDAYIEALVELPDKAHVRLTDVGVREAARVTRNHRLWEIYLIEYADIAPSHVDRDADAIEHILGAKLTAKLEATMADSTKLAGMRVPGSPHPIH